LHITHSSIHSPLTLTSHSLILTNLAVVTNVHAIILELTSTQFTPMILQGMRGQRCHWA